MPCVSANTLDIVPAFALDGFSQPDNHVKRLKGDRNALWFVLVAFFRNVFPTSFQVVHNVFNCKVLSQIPYFSSLHPQAIVTTMAQNWYFIAAATTLMARLRFNMFTSILRQDSTFYLLCVGSLVSKTSH